jgi:DNA-binding NarL/FixJ family response regulator
MVIMAIKVLHIEDNPHYADCLKLYFEKYNVEIDIKIEVDTCVDNLNDAIMKLKEKVYDFILVDMELHNDPKAGIKIIKEISLLTNAYILILSGSDLNKNTVYEAYEAGAYAYEYKSHIEKIPIVLDDIIKGYYIPRYYIQAQKIKSLKNEQQIIVNDINNKLTTKEISIKHNKSYVSTTRQIRRIKEKLGPVWKYIFGKK